MSIWELPPTPGINRKHPYGWVVAGYSCGHTVDSPGCIVAGTHAGILGRRDALPVARESPPCAPAAFHGLLAGYVLRLRDKSAGRPTKTSHKIPRAARRAPRVSHSATATAFGAKKGESESSLRARPRPRH